MTTAKEKAHKPPAVNLQDVSDAELAAEINRRADEKAAQERAARLARCQLFIKHRVALLELVGHSRRSCAQGRMINACYHPQHGVAECSRCCLEALTERDDVDINLSLQMTNVRLRDES